jgi:hypothetical protein
MMMMSLMSGESESESEFRSVGAREWVPGSESE